MSARTGGGLLSRTLLELEGAYFLELEGAYFLELEGAYSGWLMEWSLPTREARRPGDPKDSKPRIIINDYAGLWTR